VEYQMRNVAEGIEEAFKATSQSLH